MFYSEQMGNYKQFKANLELCETDDFFFHVNQSVFLNRFSES